MQNLQNRAKIVYKTHQKPFATPHPRTKTFKHIKTISKTPTKVLKQPNNHLKPHHMR
jgi:hypothetical protein